METPKYELKINAFAPGELAALVNGLAEQLSGRVKAHIAASDLAPVEEPADMNNIVDELEKSPAVAPKAKSKKHAKVVVHSEPVERELTKEEIKELKEEDESVTSGTTDEPITKEQIAQALQSVSEKVNFQKAKEILSSYKKEDGSPCKKVSDVQATDYAAFMADCGKAI